MVAGLEGECPPWPPKMGVEKNEIPNLLSPKWGGGGVFKTRGAVTELGECSFEMTYIPPPLFALLRAQIHLESKKSQIFLPKNPHFKGEGGFGAKNWPHQSTSLDEFHLECDILRIEKRL